MYSAMEWYVRVFDFSNARIVLQQVALEAYTGLKVYDSKREDKKLVA